MTTRTLYDNRANADAVRETPTGTHWLFRDPENPARGTILFRLSAGGSMWADEYGEKRRVDLPSLDEMWRNVMSWVATGDKKPDTKYCPKCQQRKPLDLFPPHKRYADGVNRWCRACNVESTRKWREQKRAKA